MERGTRGLTRFDGPIMGPNAQALKYDVLTALQALGAHGERPARRLALRLAFLVTARYSWTSRSFCVGIRELARMWNVSERSAIRDMVLMRRLGWIAVTVPAAKGRVAHHRIDLPAVLTASMPHWDAVGEDFAARMAGVPERGRPQEGEGGNVVPLRPEERALPEDDGTGWQGAAIRLMQQSPASYRNWFSQLAAGGLKDGVLTLRAPSAFAAHHLRTHHHTQVLAAAVTANRAVRDVKFEGPSQR